MSHRGLSYGNNLGWVEMPRKNIYLSVEIEKRLADYREKE